jgi:hypothetical protein
MPPPGLPRGLPRRSNDWQLNGKNYQEFVPFSAAAAKRQQRKKGTKELGMGRHTTSNKSLPHRDKPEGGRHQVALRPTNLRLVSHIANAEQRKSVTIRKTERNDRVLALRGI